MRDDSSAAPGPAVRRLASWLRGRRRTQPAPGVPPEEPPATGTPPPSRLRRQPEDDASVYPLF
ncbi:hypothetical protein [Streptomyces poriticola]|uniref:hypothetical protein n=1 Tax=Streptomyces poriticola TaxID=3120506 RepID=UPI002FCE1A8D